MERTRLAFGRARALLTIGVLFAGACGGREEAPPPPSVGAIAFTAVSEPTPNVNVRLSLPSAHGLSEVALSAGDRLSLGDAVTVTGAEAPEAPAMLVNRGKAETELGAEARTGHVISNAIVRLRSRSRVDGDVRSAAMIERQDGVVVTGLSVPNEPPAMRDLLLPLSVQPGSTYVHLEPGQSLALAPGRYAALIVKSRSVVRLEAGKYEFDRIQIEPQAEIRVNTQGGPVLALVKSSIDFKGTIGTIGPRGAFLLGYTGVQPVSIESGFDGSILAPFADLRLAPTYAGHRGSFFGKSVRVEARTPIRFEPFRHWAALFGLRTFVSCLSRSRVDSAAGIFGYESENASAIDVPLGPDNALIGTIASTPTVTFLPGRSAFAFYGYFNPTATNAIWSLLGSEVAATDSTPRCAADEAVSVPDIGVAFDQPGRVSDAARGRALPNVYGAGYSTVPVPPVRIEAPAGLRVAPRTTPLAATNTKFRLTLTNVTAGDDGCGDNDLFVRPVIVNGVDFGRRDLEDCVDDNSCRETFEVSIESTQATVPVSIDLWDADALFCGGDDRQLTVALTFDAKTGQTLGGGLTGFDPAESRFIDPGATCVRSADGDGFCWSVEVVRPPEICLEWRADFIDSGPWSDGSSEDFGAVRGAQVFPASRALARVILADTTRERFRFEGVLDMRGCIPTEQLPSQEAWARGEGFEASFAVATQLCADPSGALCALDSRAPRGPANIVVADSRASGMSSFCSVLTEREGRTVPNCKVTTASQGAFAGWPDGGAPPIVRANGADGDSLTPATRVAAVVGQILQREAESDGDLSVTLGLVERRYADASAPTIYAYEACPGTRTACASGNQLFLEPDDLLRPGVPGSHRFKYVVAHEFGHFFQAASQGRFAFDYSGDDATARCACRHVVPGDDSHCLQSLESIGAGQSEGYAHFLAAKTWNRSTEPDCTFVNYKEFLDTSCRPGSEECAPDPDAPGLFRSQPPYPISCATRTRWRNSVCFDGTQTDDKLRQAVEVDWLQFYWSVNTDVLERRWSTRRIHDAYVSACGDAPCAGQVVAWADLVRGATAVAGGEGRDAAFREAGQVAGVADRL